MPVPVRDTKENTIDFSPLKQTADTWVGFWWSDADWQWWGITLGEVWEQSGNTDMDVEGARQWVTANTGLSLNRAKGLDRPTDDTKISAGSGRPAPSGGGGGGRGGGAAKPVYIAPNREEVEEQLKSYVVATTGVNNPDVLRRATDAYLKADKAAWDQQTSGKGGEAPSPFMEAKNVVRATDEYKTIHYLRPDSVDEMDWVSSAQGKLRQLGVSAARSEELGIRQASVGATDKDLVGASEVSLQSNNKLMADSQRAKLKQSVSAVARMIK